MSLPPALLERLKRRKIIQDQAGDRGSISTARPNPASTSAQRSNLAVGSLQDKYEERPKPKGRFDPEAEPEEEIIAEDYSEEEDAQDATSDLDQEDGEERFSNDESGDEQSDCYDEEQTKSSPNNTASHAAKTDCSTEHLNEKGGLVTGHTSLDEPSLSGEPNARHGYMSVIGCPNKYNIYHICEQYCCDKYSQLEPDQGNPSKEQRRLLALLLKAFPMSNDWTVVFDPGVKTFYFWNMVSNQVSWVPPGMGTFTSPPADKIRQAYMEANPRIPFDEGG